MPSASDTHDTRTQGRPGAAPAVFSPRGGLHEAPLVRGLGAHGAPHTPPKELGRAVDQMLAESGVEKPAPAPAAQEPAAEEVQSLDQQLAKAADDLMAGEGAAEAEAAPAATAPAAPAAAAPSAPAPEQPVVDEEQRRQMELAQSAVRPQAPKPAAPVKAEAPAQPQTASAPAPPTPPAPKPSAPTKPAEATVLPPPPVPGATPPAGQAGAKTAARPALAGRLARAILEGLSSPLKNQPQYIRDTVGWVALVHLFMAACVWVYIVAIRSPVAAEPAVAVTPAVENAEHGKPAKAAHKTPVKKSNPKNAPAKDKDAHASAAH